MLGLFYKRLFRCEHHQDVSQEPRSDVGQASLEGCGQLGNCQLPVLLSSYYSTCQLNACASVWLV